VKKRRRPGSCSNATELQTRRKRRKTDRDERFVFVLVGFASRCAIGRIIGWCLFNIHPSRICHYQKESTKSAGFSSFPGEAFYDYSNIGSQLPIRHLNQPVVSDVMRFPSSHRLHTVSENTLDTALFNIEALKSKL